MLTGDENIVDVQFTVLLAHQAERRRRLPLQHPEPEGTVKAVAESAMREVGRPHQHPADSHHQEGRCRERGPRADAKDAR